MKAIAPYDDRPKFKSGMEEAYWNYLYVLKEAKEILCFNYEQISFTIGVDEKGHARRYTPDFCVVNASREVEFHETKGSKDARGQKAALGRLYAAASKYSIFRWVLVTKNEFGGWSKKEVKA